MPPFVSVNCDECKSKNRYDLAELRRKDGSLFKHDGTAVRQTVHGEEEEFVVNCSACGHEFKLTVKGKEHGED